MSISPEAVEDSSSAHTDVLPSPEGSTSSPPKVSEAASTQNSNDRDYVLLTEQPLEEFDLNALVRDETAGAISTFVGTTRNHFQGKKVLKLEYEAYEPMAEKELRVLIKEVRAKWDLCRVAMLHKIGECPIMKASVMIAVSSVHRRESLEAVHYAIDQLKARIPIWKREFYADGSVWKQNAEFSPEELTSAHNPESSDGAKPSHSKVQLDRPPCRSCRRD